MRVRCSGSDTRDTGVDCLSLYHLDWSTPENLVVHLLNHEHVAAESHEAEVTHLRSELRWSSALAQRAIRQAERAGLVEQHGDRLTLTEAGRALARQAQTRAER